MTRQVAEARQLGDDVLGQAVGEEFLLRIAAHVDEAAARRWTACWRSGGAAAAVRLRRRSGRGPMPKDADRPAMFLTVLLAEILEGELEPVADLIAHGARDADAAGLGQHLRDAPRR